MRSKNNCVNDSDFCKLRRLEVSRDRSIDRSTVRQFRKSVAIWTKRVLEIS